MVNSKRQKVFSVHLIHCKSYIEPRKSQLILRKKDLLEPNQPELPPPPGHFDTQ